MTLEELLDKGFSRDDIMKLADTGAFSAPKKEENEKAEETEVKGAEVPKDDSVAAMIGVMSQMMENQNKLFMSMMEQKKTEEETQKEATAEEKARQFSDEQLLNALQSLNISTNGANIDINSTVEKNINDKILQKLGNAVGFVVDKSEENKEG